MKSCPLASVIRLFIIFILLSGLSYFSPAKPAYADSPSGNALRFDGTDDYVAIASPTNLDLANNFTIEAWVNTYDTGQTRRIFGKTVSSGGGYGFGIIGHQLRFTAFGVQDYDTTLANLLAYQWYHVAVVFDSSNDATFYVDGNLIQTVTGLNGSAITGVGSASIGNNPRWNTEYWSGLIDEVRVWSVARTADQIRDNMYRELTGSESGLLAYYRLNESGATTTAADSSGHSNTGALMNGTTNTPAADGTANGPLWRTSGAFAGPRNALNWDGTNDYVDLSTNAPTLGAAFTEEAWVYVPSPFDSNYHGFLGQDIGSASSRAPSMWVYGATGGLQYGFGDGTTFYSASVNNVLTADAWHHVATTFDGTNYRLYVDGIERNNYTGAAGRTPASTGVRYIGRVDTYFAGSIDEVRIWNTTRSATDIQNNMMRPLKGDEANLAAYYRMDYGVAGGTNTGLTTLYDIASGGRDGTLTNFALSGTASNWVSSSAYNTWLGSEDTDWATVTNWSSGAAPGSGDNVGVYGYTGGNDPLISASADANQVVIAADGTLAVSGSITPTFASLANNGTISQTQTANGSSDVTFAGVGNYGGVTINANGSGLGSTTVVIKGNQACLPGGTSLIHRCFTITPDNTAGRSATVTFYYLNSELNSYDCSTMNVYRWAGTQWVSAGTGPTRNCPDALPGTLDYVQVSGVSDFSPFGATSGSPTAVTLQHLAAHASQNGIPVVPAVLVLGLGGLVLTWQARRLARTRARLGLR